MALEPSIGQTILIKKNYCSTERRVARSYGIYMRITFFIFIGISRHVRFPVPNSGHRSTTCIAAVTAVGVSRARWSDGARFYPQAGLPSLRLIATQDKGAQTGVLFNP